MGRQYIKTRKDTWERADTATDKLQSQEIHQADHFQCQSKFSFDWATSTY